MQPLRDSDRSDGFITTWYSHASWLNAPIYTPSSAYGHFGRAAGEAGPGTFSWEATDLAEAILLRPDWRD